MQSLQSQSCTYPSFAESCRFVYNHRTSACTSRHTRQEFSCSWLFRHSSCRTYLITFIAPAPTTSNHWQQHQSHRPRRSCIPGPCSLPGISHRRMDSSHSDFHYKLVYMMLHKCRSRRTDRTRCQSGQSIQIFRIVVSSFWPETAWSAMFITFEKSDIPVPRAWVHPRSPILCWQTTMRSKIACSGKKAASPPSRLVDDAKYRALVL